MEICREALDRCYPWRLWLSLGKQEERWLWGSSICQRTIQRTVQLRDQGGQALWLQGLWKEEWAVRLGPAELVEPAFPVWMGRRSEDRRSEQGGTCLFPHTPVSTLTPELQKFLCSSLIQKPNLHNWCFRRQRALWSLLSLVNVYPHHHSNSLLSKLKGAVVILFSLVLQGICKLTICVSV